ncbi:hypothetical protein V2O64_16115 [Verrucomicrobiaceae bacterium 227]
MILNFTEHAPFAIFTVAGLALLGIIFGIPTSYWISGKLANFLSFFPTTTFNRTVPLLSRGEALTMQGRVSEAAEIYESFLEEHSDNLDLYIHLVDLAFGPLNDHPYGNLIIKRGDEHLTPRGQRVLRIHREAILSGELHPHQHLDWREDQKTDHPEVAIPESLKGQFIQQP